jgi:hypothetical protein
MKKILKFLESKILLIQELESKITELEIKLFNSNNKIYELESEIESKSFDRFDLSNEKTKLKTQLEKANNLIEFQNEKIKDFESGTVIQELKLTIQLKDAEILNLIAQNENDLKIINSHVHNEKAYNKLVSENQNLILKNAELSKEVDFLTQENSNIRIENENALKSVESQNERISKLIIWGNDNEAKNKILEQENKNLVLSNEINYNKIVEYQTEIENLKNENLLLQKSIDKNSIEKTNPEIDKIAELKIKLSEFFKDLLSSEDLEDLLDKFDYEMFFINKRTELTPDSIINHYLLWDTTNKKHDYWESIFNKLYDMENKPIFTV